MGLIDIDTDRAACRVVMLARLVVLGKRPWFELAVDLSEANGWYTEVELSALRLTDILRQQRDR